jgi:uncharacterized protein (TIGR02996 family)
MNMESALLETLHEQPTDRTVWLVLADWLEDQGESERAELVRLRYSLQETLDHQLREAQEARSRALLAAGVRPMVPLLVNSLGQHLALIQPGHFMMGSPSHQPGRYSDEDPWHRVVITRPFYLSATPVTQGQYQRLIGHNPSHFSNLGEGKGRVKGMETRAFPVENVSWFDAATFCIRLSETPEERQAGRVYRLPTEAEWEYACRAGVRADQFHVGSALSSLQANINGNQPFGDAPLGPFLGRPCPVASFPPNAWGLYDLHGNVWEWCSDWYDAHYYRSSPLRDPPGPTHPADGYRSIRGGSWNFRAGTCRTAYRLRLMPEVRTYDVGFRVVCMVVGG